MAELTIKREHLDSFLKGLGIDTEVLPKPELESLTTESTEQETPKVNVEAEGATATASPETPEIPESVELPKDIVLLLSAYAEKCRKSIEQFENNEGATTPNMEKLRQELVKLQNRQAELRLLSLENEKDILKAELELQKIVNTKQIHFTQSQNVKSMLAGYEFGVKDFFAHTSYPELKDYITHLDKTKTKMIVKK